MGIPAMASIPSIYLLFLPLLLIYAQEDNSSPKNCSNSFRCGNNGLNIQLLLYNNDTHPGCGLIPVSCSGTRPIIYFGWSSLTSNIEFEVIRFINNQSARVISLKLQDFIRSGSCEIFSYLNPLYYSYNYIFYTISPSLSLFHCDTTTPELKKITDIFFKDSYYSYGNCSGPTVYYPHSKSAFQNTPDNCKHIQLPISEVNPISEDLFSFLGNEFRLGWNVSSKCMDCHLGGGLCSISNQKFDCANKVPGRHFMKLNIKIIGIIGASIIGALLSIIGVWCFYNSVKKEISKRRRAKFFNENGGMLLQQQLSSGHGSVEKTKLFESFELEKATNFYNVDRVLGQGGQGTVYKGVLPNGSLIAVKKSKVVDKSNIGLFINEIVILSQINHRNVVNLLGCCLETKVPLLVYELIPNGTLFQHIHNPTKEFPLNWEVRLQIAAEIAGALYYMHSAASMPIYHRDIKSTNILLDDNYNAKISDFGISRLVDVENSHLTTHVKGTFGYLDPEYFLSHQFNEKSDVYSFGVVLVELLTGQKPIISRPYEESKGLASLFMETMDENHLFEIIDPELSKEDKIEEIIEVAHLAKACLKSKGKKRPTMKEVTIQLEGIRTSREQSMPREIDESNVVEEAYDDSSSSTEAWDHLITPSAKDDINSSLNP